jgi:putative endonuclease
MTTCGKSYFVYILASKPHGVLYIGLTSDLLQRMWQHQTGFFPGFTRKYNVHRLVHVETYDDAETAVRRERSLKAWCRAWKIELIETGNPEWLDLSRDLALP